MITPEKLIAMQEEAIRIANTRIAKLEQSQRDCFTALELANRILLQMPADLVAKAHKRPGLQAVSGDPIGYIREVIARNLGIV